MIFKLQKEAQNFEIWFDFYSHILVLKFIFMQLSCRQPFIAVDRELQQNWALAQSVDNQGIAVDSQSNRDWSCLSLSTTDSTINRSCAVFKKCDRWSHACRQACITVDNQVVKLACFDSNNYFLLQISPDSFLAIISWLYFNCLYLLSK